MYMKKEKDNERIPLLFVKTSNLQPQCNNWKYQCELEGLIECKEENEYKYNNNRKLLIMTENHNDNNDNTDKRVHRTIKYMQAIANGDWILNSTFLRDLLQNKINNIDLIMNMLSEYEIKWAYLDELKWGPRRSRIAKENGKLDILKGYHITLVKYDTTSKYNSGFEKYFSLYDNMCYEFQNHSFACIPDLIEILGGRCSVYDNTYNNLNLFSSSSSSSNSNCNIYYSNNSNNNYNINNINNIKNIFCILCNKSLTNINVTQTKKRKTENFDENKVYVQYHWILDTISNFSIMDVSNYLIF